MDDLDDFLDQGTQPLEQEPEAVEPQQPETIGQPRDEAGRFAPKQETGVVPQETAEVVPPTTDKLPPETFKGLQDERRKRQEAEQRLAALEAQLQAFQTPPAPPPSIWEDDAGALQHVQQQAVSQAVQQATFNARLDMSEMMVRQSQPDFEDMKAKFLEMAELNPSLRQQALADPHPWNKAYQIAKNAAKMEALGAVDVSELENRLREQIKAELEAQKPQVATPTLPVSLADSQSARSSYTGQPQLLSLEDILKR